MPSKPWICANCGGLFGANPRMARLLHGSAEHTVTGNLCWICAHLLYSVRQQAEEMNRQFEGIGESE